MGEVVRHACDRANMRFESQSGGAKFIVGFAKRDLVRLQGEDEGLPDRERRSGRRAEEKYDCRDHSARSCPASRP